MTVNCHSKSESDARYVQVAPSDFIVLNSGGPQLKLITLASRAEMRYKGGVFRIRRQATNGSLTNHCQFVNTTGGSTIFYNGISNTSDTKLKYQVTDISAKAAWAIGDQVRPKSYVRNDLENQPRVGFIAQDLQKACTVPFACIVGEAEQDDGETLLTVDYARLNTILFRCAQDLSNKLKVLETANKSG